MMFLYIMGVKFWMMVKFGSQIHKNLYISVFIVAEEKYEDGERMRGMERMRYWLILKDLGKLVLLKILF